MTVVPMNATICGGPGPHPGIGMTVKDPCPTCDGLGWYVGTPPILKERMPDYRPLWHDDCLPLEEPA